MDELEALFSDKSLSLIRGYPAVFATVKTLVQIEQIPSARLLCFITAMAEHRGDEIDVLRLELGLRPLSRFRRL